MSIVLNIVIIFGTIMCMKWHFTARNGKTGWENGTKSLRFFTVQSNILSAIAAAAVLISELQHKPLTPGLSLFKFIGASAVGLTFTIVMIYLGPRYGYKSQLEKQGIHMHVVGPLAAIISWCFLEREVPLTFAQAFYGALPAAIYGAIYAVMVVFTGKWDDFYGFNSHGKWYITGPAVALMGLLVSMILCFLHSI